MQVTIKIKQLTVIAPGGGRSNDRPEVRQRARTGRRPLFVWKYRGRQGLPVWSKAQLEKLLVETLPFDGDWGVLEFIRGVSWAQCMKVHGGWIVEVDGVDLPVPMCRRVHEIGASLAEEDRMLNLAPDGRSTASWLDGDRITTAEATGRVLWAWMARRVPDGYALRDVTEGVD